MESGARPTQPRGQGTFERIEHGFENAMAWAGDRWLPLFIGLIALLVLGVVLAVAYEWSQAQRSEAFAALAKAERALQVALPPDPTGLGASEPANPELGQKARQQALADFEELATQHAGSIVGSAATLRAAEMEIDLDRLDAADERLAAFTAETSDPTWRATALRLHGYVLERLERPGDAAEAYLEAGAETRYPGRADAFWQAGLAFERAGQLERALEAYDAVVSVSPELAEQNRVSDRLAPLRARLATPEAPGSGTLPPAAAPEPVADEEPDATPPDGVE